MAAAQAKDTQAAAAVEAKVIDEATAEEAKHTDEAAVVVVYTEDTDRATGKEEKSRDGWGENSGTWIYPG